MSLPADLPRSVGAWLGASLYRWRLRALVVAMVVHTALLAAAIDDPRRAYTAGDSQDWDTLARNILQHRVFSLSSEPPFEPNVFRTPGYPLLVAAVYALTGSRLEAVLALQTGLAVVSAVVLFEVGMSIGFPASSAGLGAVLISFLPMSSVFWATLASENLFVFFMLLAFWAAWRSSQRSELMSAVAGLLSGLMVLSRPIGVLLLPIMGIALAWKRPVGRSTLRLACSALGFAVILGPWWWRNYAVFGRPALSTVGSINLLTYNAAAVLAHGAGQGFWEGRYLIWEYWDRYYESLDPKPANAVQDADARRRAAVQIIAEQPFYAAWVNSVEGLNSLRPGVSQLTLFVAPDAFEEIPAYDEEASPAAHSLNQPTVLFTTLLLTGFYGFVYIAFAAGAALMIGERRWRAVITLLAPTAFLMLAPGPVASSRFRVPAEPLIALVAAHAIWYTYRRWQVSRANLKRAAS